MAQAREIPEPSEFHAIEHLTGDVLGKLWQGQQLQLPGIESYSESGRDSDGDAHERERFENARQDRLLKEFETHLKSSRAFQWLSARAGFTKALESFERKQKAARSAPTLLNRSAYPRFLRALARRLGDFSANLHGIEKSRHPTKRDLRSALQHAEKLMELGKNGFWRVEEISWQQIERPLKSFTSALRTVGLKARRPRADKALPEREFAEGLALDFFQEFGEPLSTCIKHLSAVIGYEVDDSNLEARIRAARARHLRRTAVH